MKGRSLTPRERAAIGAGAQQPGAHPTSPAPDEPADGGGHSPHASGSDDVSSEAVFAGVTAEISRAAEGCWVTLDRLDGDGGFVLASHGGPSLVGERFDAGPSEPGEIGAATASVEVAGSLWGMLTIIRPDGPIGLGLEHMLEPWARLVSATVHASRDGARATAGAGHQAGLSRVCRLVARGAPRRGVFENVAREACRLPGVDTAGLFRFGADGSVEIIFADGATRTAFDDELRVGGGESAGLVRSVWKTGRSMRVDDTGEGPSPPLSADPSAGSAVSAVAVPIRTQQAMWGALAAIGHRSRLPQRTEDCLEDYAEIVAMAISADEARQQMDSLAEERAALRRVADIVARGADPKHVFVAVTAEASALLGGLATELLRFEGDTAIVMAAHNSLVPLGLRVAAHDGTPTGAVQRTGRPVRADSFDGTPLEGIAREVGITSGVAVPVSVEGRVRAALTASSSGAALPDSTEARLTQLAELAAVAIANAETNAKLVASRARVVATADEARRRLQRDVHDGAQQQLVQAVITLRLARASVEAGSAAGALMNEALAHLERAASELRDTVHGILPRSLTHGGLQAGLESLVAGLALPVELRVDTPRLPAPIETTAYFVVAEALTNTVKHSQAHRAALRVEFAEDVLVVEVEDDGLGGADPLNGTGLVGLHDRVDAAAGTLQVSSPEGRGTIVRAELPVLW